RHRLDGTFFSSQCPLRHLSAIDDLHFKGWSATQTRSCRGVDYHGTLPRCAATHVDARRSRYVRWRTDLLVPTPYIETRSGKTHSRRADRMTNAFTGTIVGARTPRLGRCLHETRTPRAFAQSAGSPTRHAAFSPHGPWQQAARTHQHAPNRRLYRCSARNRLRARARGINTVRTRWRHFVSTTASCDSGLCPVSGRHPDRAGSPSCTLATAAPDPTRPCGATGVAVRLLLQPLLPPVNGAESVKKRCLCVRYRTRDRLLHDHAGVAISVRCCP